MHKFFTGVLLLLTIFALQAAPPLIFRIVAPNSQLECDKLQKFLESGGAFDAYTPPADTEFIQIGKGYVLVGKRQITVTKIMEVTPRKHTEHDVVTDKGGNEKVKDPRVIRSVGVELYPKDGQKFKDFTAEHIGYQLLIMMDGQILCAPTINQKFSRELNITVSSEAKYKRLLTSLKAIEVVP